jgi:membrane protein DedA with SNARE-associated domain
MPDLGLLMDRWGYAIIAGIVILGNVGVPVPEETVLFLAGYLVLQGKLRFSLVVLVGILSAIAGDNLGYWFGRGFGRKALERYERWIFISTKQLDCTQRLMTRYGPLAVFGARFVPGLRFLAGPVAGIVGLSPGKFMVANVLGASVYVPLVVGTGYGLIYGIKDYVFRFEAMIGHVEHYLPLLAILLTAVFLVWRRWRVVHEK